MLGSDLARFAEALLRLRNCYGAFFGDAAEWKTRTSTYFEQLRKHEVRDVEEALKRAPGPDFHPDRLPTAGQLQRIVVAVEVERKQAKNDATRREMQRTEDERILEEFAAVPVWPAAQAEYIAEAANEYERLGRRWQCESKTAGFDPLKPSPPSVQSRRMREFWDLWGSHEPRTLATPSFRRAAQRAQALDANARQVNAEHAAAKAEFGPGADPEAPDETGEQSNQQPAA